MSGIMPSYVEAKVSMESVIHNGSEPPSADGDFIDEEHERPYSPNTKMRNLCRFTLNQNLIGGKKPEDANAADWAEPDGSLDGKDSLLATDAQAELFDDNRSEMKKSDNGIENVSTETGDNYLSSIQYTIPQPYYNNYSNTEDTYEQRHEEYPVRPKHLYSFDDIRSQSAFQHRMHKYLSPYSGRYNSLRPITNRSYCDVNLKALIQHEDTFLKTLRMNGEPRNRYTGCHSGKFGLWNPNHQAPKDRHLETLVKILKIYNTNNDLQHSAMHKSLFTADVSPVGDNKPTVDCDQIPKEKPDQKESSVFSDTVDPNDIQKLKTACSNMCSQLNEIHNTISYVRGDIKTLMANVSPTPSMCLMQELAELRDAYEMSVSSDRRRDVQMRKLEIQLRDICCKLDKAVLPKKKRSVMTYVLFPVIGCAAIYTLCLFVDGKKTVTDVDIVAPITAAVENVLEP